MCLGFWNAKIFDKNKNLEVFLPSPPTLTERPTVPRPKITTFDPLEISATFQAAPRPNKMKQLIEFINSKEEISAQLQLRRLTSNQQKEKHKEFNNNKHTRQ